jgi:hypothetical protein
MQREELHMNQSLRCGARTGAGARADRRQSGENADVECTAAQPEAVLPSAARMPSGMGNIQQRPSLGGVV